MLAEKLEDGKEAVFPMGCGWERGLKAPHSRKRREKEKRGGGERPHRPRCHSLWLTSSSAFSVQGGLRACDLQQKRHTFLGFLPIGPTIKRAASLCSNWIRVSSALESVNEIPGKKSNGLFTRGDFIEAPGVQDAETNGLFLSPCANWTIEECGVFLIEQHTWLLVSLRKRDGLG